MKIRQIFRTLCLLGLGFILQISESLAQCAMCRATVENNVSEGSGLGVGLNNGILYLAAIPYIIFAGIAYLWYRNSKLYRAKQNKVSRYYIR